MVYLTDCFCVFSSAKCSNLSDSRFGGGGGADSCVAKDSTTPAPNQSCPLIRLQGSRHIFLTLYNGPDDVGLYPKLRLSMWDQG